jgi:hypothetical protein
VEVGVVTDMVDMNAIAMSEIMMIAALSACKGWAGAQAIRKDSVICEGNSGRCILGALI